MNRGFGWKGFIPDNRDGLFAYRGIAQAVEIPDVKYTWRPRFPEVWDQENSNSCGPHSAIALYVSTMIQSDYDEWPGDPEYDFPRLSPLALYYFYREATGEVYSDNGVYNRTMMKVLSEKGSPLESLWSFDVAKLTVKPPVNAYEDATERLKKHGKIIYHALYTVEEMINCLAEGFGFLGGIPVYESFRSIGSDGVVPMPGRNDKLLGGHDMFYWGYDKNNKWIHFQNSWGPTFGKNGHGVLPFEYAEKMLLDGWTMRFEKPE